MSSPNFYDFPSSVYVIDDESFFSDELVDDIELDDDVQRSNPLGGYVIKPRQRVSSGPVLQTYEVRIGSSLSYNSLLTNQFQGIPGVKCPNCAAKGQTVWVIRGRACEVCKTPVLG